MAELLAGPRARLGRVSRHLWEKFGLGRHILSGEICEFACEGSGVFKGVEPFNMHASTLSVIWHWD